VASSPIARGTTDKRRTTTTNSSSLHHHDSAPSRPHPLICTGAEPIHPVHGPPKLRAWPWPPETRSFFCHFGGSGLSWVFTTQERKKESGLICDLILRGGRGLLPEGALPEEYRGHNLDEQCLEDTGELVPYLSVVRSLPRHCFIFIFVESISAQPLWMLGCSKHLVLLPLVSVF